MKNIEEAARKFLARNKVSAFPVDTVEIAKSKGYTVASYSQAKGLLKLSCLASYAQGHRGFSAKLANTVYIFYSDDLSPDNLRRVVAHELGHIYLHFTINGVIGDSADAEAMQEMEEEAEEFARLILAPPYVLSALKVTGLKEIMDLTGLTKADAQIVAAKVSEYDEQKQDAAENRKIENKFLSEKIRWGTKRHYRGIITALVIVLSVTVSLFGLCLATGKFVEYRLYKPQIDRGNSSSEMENLPSETKFIPTTSSPSKQTTTSQVDASSMPSSISESVYVTQSGEKYHYAGCQYIRGKDNLSEMTEAEAIGEGYEPCSVCCK